MNEFWTIKIFKCFHRLRAVPPDLSCWQLCVTVGNPPTKNNPGCIPVLYCLTGLVKTTSLRACRHINIAYFSDAINFLPTCYSYTIFNTFKTLNWLYNMHTSYKYSIPVLTRCVTGCDLSPHALCFQVHAVKCSCTNIHSKS